MIKDYFKMAFQSIRYRKLRSYLTMLGIIIGIVSLVSLITLGNSLEKGIEDQFSQFGTRRLFIGPKIVGGFGGPPSGISPLTERDVEVLENIPQVEYVSAIFIERFTITYGREERSTDVRGIDVENLDKFYADIGLRPASGRLLGDQDHYAAFVGAGFAEDFFDREIPVKGGITINDQKFRVVGILERQGSQDQDYLISIPLETMQELLGRPGALSAIAVTVNKGVDLDQVEAKIQHTLERRRGDENFQVTSPQKIAAQAGTIINIVSLIVGAIAFISLIVGALGIMNSMYTSVFERTREIGVMKAIGARNSAITLLFLIESGFMGIIGGFIGIVIGLLLSWLATLAIGSTGAVSVSFYVDPNLVVFGLLFSFLLGMGSGALPAFKAAKLKPADSLRYE